jgi:hypothetical protein
MSEGYSEVPIPLILMSMIALSIILTAISDRYNKDIDEQKATAEARSWSMLHSLLSQPELDQISHRGYLEIPSQIHPLRVYRVASRPGLVYVYEKGMLACRLCVGATDYLPSGDVILLHKLMIECDEEYYLRTANELPAYPAEI